MDRNTGSDDRGVGLEEDDRIFRRGIATHLDDVLEVVLAHADHLAGQDRRQQSHIGQRPVPLGESRRTEGMLGDLAGHGGIALTLDTDKGDPVGAGNTTEAHS